jgi:hypothetical protein
MESLPEGFLRSSLVEAVLIFKDASMLYRAYYSLDDVSNYKILEIVRNNKLEDVPRMLQVSTLMTRVTKHAKEANEYAKRFGLPVSEK